LASKSFALDTALIRAHEIEIKLKAAEEKLNVAKEKMKSQGQLLDSAQQVLSKREFSSLAVISSAVANVMAPVKNHIPEFDAKLLRKDFTVDDAEQAPLVDSDYDTAQHFVSLYDFSALAEPMITIVLLLCNLSSVGYNKLLLTYENIHLVRTNTL
jgi:hypothetical protein